MSSNTRKNNKALIEGTLIYAIGTFGTKILNFLIVPLYTYYIEPSDLGTYDLLVTTVSLLSPILTMKISDATYRWIIGKKENEVPYISATYRLLVRNCIVAALTILIINHFVPIWHCYYFVAILIGDRILECLQKLLRGLKNQKLFAASGVFHTAVFVGLNVVKVCFLHKGVTALLESSVISLYASICLILILEKRVRTVDFKGDARPLQKEMLKYSIPLVPSTLSWWVMSASDRYVIRWLIGAAANGIYSVSYKFPSVVQMVFTMFNNSWTDMALAQLKKGDESEKYAKSIFKQLYTISFSLSFVLIPFTKVVMKVILSQKYKIAANYMGFLYLGTVFQGLSTFCNIGYLQGKKTSGAAKTSIAGAAVNLGIDLVFIRYIGLYAAAISTFVGYFVMWLMRMKDIKQTFPIHVDKKNFAVYTAIGICLAIATAKTPIWADLALTAVFAVLFIFLNKSLIRTLLQGLRGRLRKRS